MKRQKQIIDAIKAYKAANGGNSPSERELATAVKIGRTTLRHHIGKMLEGNPPLLRRSAGSWRSLEIATQQ